MVLLSTQMFALSAFLNISQAPWFSSLGSTISFIYSIFLILFIFGIIMAMYFTMKRFMSSRGVEVDQIKLLHNVKSESSMQVHYKTYKYLIKTVIFSISICFFNRIPILGCAILILGDIFQVGWLIWKRPYNSIFLNIKDIIEGVSMIFIGILYILIILFQNDELMQEVFGIAILSIIFILFVLGILGKTISRKSI